jgi:hypothetical protein
MTATAEDQTAKTGWEDCEDWEDEQLSAAELRERGTHPGLIRLRDLRQLHFDRMNRMNRMTATALGTALRDGVVRGEPPR